LKPSTNHTNQQQTHGFDKIKLKIGHGSHTCAVPKTWCQGLFLILKAMQGNCTPKCTKTQGWCYLVYGNDQLKYNILGEW
jgi:hypothetical protein